MIYLVSTVKKFSIDPTHSITTFILFEYFLLFKLINYIEGKWLQDNAYIVVHRIAIRNDQKGKGLAKIIIDEGLKLYPKKPSIRMDTHDDNLSMQRFLIKYGFEYCGTIYLENKETRRAYEKIL